MDFLAAERLGAALHRAVVDVEQFCGAAGGDPVMLQVLQAATRNLSCRRLDMCCAVDRFEAAQQRNYGLRYWAARCCVAAPVGVDGVQGGADFVAGQPDGDGGGLVLAVGGWAGHVAFLDVVGRSSPSPTAASCLT
ncbi:hypothetical protein H7I53_18360 [Mycolicibacterium pulveris]|uniref:hypothetical protein n=1 Tax=Mycolicibacterium pulveris TaxID=36813 RepID=UPI0013D01454|nr:hypothetical protein [Mycolicibacterium pulveris]MCV6982180.1 hypothetical protein [Mycolicibacterium pulveris]